MKILMVSIPSLHFFRWTEQLKDSGHEVYWFDITGMGGYVERLDWVRQHSDWKMKWDYPGRIFFKINFPNIYDILQSFNSKNTAVEFEKFLLEVRPDVVHSFALYTSCSPIISVMEKYLNQKWIYSSWGSDLFYFQNEPSYLSDIKRVLPRVDYLFTDCRRDFEIAKKYGFKGRFLGVFPGGGGYNLKEIEKYKLPIIQRKTILIKGFQGRSGRVLSVLKAIEQLQIELSNFQIVVFGADSQVIESVNHSPLGSWKNFKISGKITHNEVLKLMGKALIYIGNSNSDGIPNTMLEAICAGAFPIQSNPGGATAEVIQNGVNGLLIDECEEISGINKIVLKALNKVNLKEAIDYNKRLSMLFDREVIESSVLMKYDILNESY